MRTKLNLLHKSIGIITVVIFVATGVLMRFHYSRIYEANHLVRMMFRSIHIYILLIILLLVGTLSHLAASRARPA
jgi:hypothetical protein